MIYPDISLDDWLRQYPELQVYRQPCPSCGEEVVTDRPFISKRYVGLEGRACKACGFGLNSASMIPRSEESQDDWAEFFS